jgi:iron complex transport system substrate-binding protein
VQEAALNLPSNPQVLNLEPHSLCDILDNIVTVSQALGIEAEGLRVRDALQRRIDAVREKSARATHRPRVFLMEWVDAPFRGGHWMKELVDYAGGRDDLAVLHRPSSRVEWKKVQAFAPEVIVLTCCGFSLARCAQEGEILAKMEGAQELPALKSGRVYATDGSAYFSRPGPRIVESLEILAHLIHPEIFAPPPLPEAYRHLNLSSVRV